MDQLKKVIRLDSMPLVRANFTSEGYLEDRPVLTTCGIFEYTDSQGGIRRELRLPEEVFKEESLASYKGKPIIITHDAGMITKDNVADEQIGTILSEGYRSGNDVRAEIIIHDTDDMKESGLKELSLGYTLDLDETPGEWNGEHYDAVQRNILINHLALVKEARAGDQARLNIDSRNGRTKILTGGKVMVNSIKAGRADGLLSPDELQQAVAEYMAKRNAAENVQEDTGAVPADEPATEAPEAADAPVQPEAVPDPEAPAADPAPAPDAAEENSDAEALPEAPAEAVPEATEAPAAPGPDASLEEKIAYISDCRNHDGDVDKDLLYSIIDTLLAERDFSRAAEETLADDPAEAEDLAEDANADAAGDAVPSETAEETAAETADVISQTAADAGNEAPAEEIPSEESEILQEDSDEAAIPSTTEEEAEAEDKNIRSDDIESIVQARLDVALTGRSVSLEGLEKLPVMEAKKKIIAHVRPDMRLDGRSDDYINGVYALAAAEIKGGKAGGTERQKDIMFNKARNRSVSFDAADSGDISSGTAREKMIERQMNRNSTKNSKEE